MQKFQETRKSFGLVKENHSVSIEYQKTPECPKIQSLTPDCAGCTKLFDWPDKVIIQFTSGTIPPQVLLNSSMQDVDRGATITFMDGTTERLYFEGKITK